MAKLSGSTYVSTPINEGDEVGAFAALCDLAAARLGGKDGLRACAINRVGNDELAGTFTREWEEPPPPPA